MLTGMTVSGIREVLPCGTRVQMDGGRVEGRISAITIRDDLTSYEVSYWHNGERKEVWVPACEVTTNDPVALSRIGFGRELN